MMQGQKNIKLGERKFYTYNFRLMAWCSVVYFIIVSENFSIHNKETL